MSNNKDSIEYLKIENEKLKKSNKLLSEQVHKLINTESSLYRIQEQLDAQMKIYRALHDLGNQFNILKNKEDLYHSIAAFIEDDIYIQRSLFFIRENGKISCKHSYGYYQTNEYLEGLELPVEITSHLTNNGEYFRCYRSDESDIKEFLEKIDLCEFLAIPLSRNEQNRPEIVFICGNSESKRQFFSRIEKGNLYHIGIANMANQAGIALQNIANFSALLEEREQLEIKVNERTTDLTHALDEIKKLDKLKTELFANISHELRTPLTLSLGPMDLIREKYSEHIPQQANEHLDVVHKNLIRLYTLINEFLDFSALEANEAQLSLSPVDVHKSLETCLVTLSSALKKKKITLDYKNKSRSATLFLDIRKFERIIMNLLSNAFKFTPVGGHIEVYIEDKNPYELQISFKDNGPGIPKAQHDKIFDRFSQVDGSDTKEYAGTGIGLAMVKEYVELHRGEIKVDSEIGRGTQMIVTLKKGSDHFENEKINEKTQDIDQKLITNSMIKDFSFVDNTSHGNSFHSEDHSITDENGEVADLSLRKCNVKGTILVAEDNYELRNFLKTFLSEQHIVHTAHDGLDAWNKLQKIQPDLIISDVMMPNMSGSKLCEKVKSDIKLSGVPFILLTAKLDNDLKLAGLKMGVDEYLNKPFNPTELLARVNNMIKLRQFQKNLIIMNNDLENANKKIKDQQSTLIKSEKMNVLGEIVAGVSHELSSPLLALTAGLSWFNKYIDELEKELSHLDKDVDVLKIQGARRSKKSKIMNSSINNMKEHINKLKSFIRFQSSDSLDFDLNNEIETSLHILSYLKPSHVEIQSELETGLPKILGNPAEINQLLSNLIKNAIEAIPDDRKGLISIKSKYLNDDSVELRISDNGQGIDKEIKDGLFKEIRTSKNKGTGVGLYLCKNIIKNNKIDVVVESEQNIGTTFILNFKEIIKSESNGMNDVEEKKSISH